MPPRRGRWDQEAGRDMTPPAWLPVVLPSLLIGLMLAASLMTMPPTIAILTFASVPIRKYSAKRWSSICLNRPMALAASRKLIAGHWLTATSVTTMNASKNPIRRPACRMPSSDCSPPASWR